MSPILYSIISVTPAVSNRNTVTNIREISGVRTRRILLLRVLKYDAEKKRRMRLASDVILRTAVYVVWAPRSIIFEAWIRDVFILSPWAGTIACAIAGPSIESNCATRWGSICTAYLFPRFVRRKTSSQHRSASRRRVCCEVRYAPVQLILTVRIP